MLDLLFYIFLDWHDCTIITFNGGYSFLERIKRKAQKVFKNLIQVLFRKKGAIFLKMGSYNICLGFNFLGVLLNLPSKGVFLPQIGSNWRIGQGKTTVSVSVTYQEWPDDVQKCISLSPQVAALHLIQTLHMKVTSCEVRLRTEGSVVLCCVVNYSKRR